jgi:hypothetical protein
MPLKTKTPTLKVYPRAFTQERRVHGRDPQIIPTRIKFLKSAFLNLLILQILFLLLFAYLYGSLYRLNYNVHNLNILMVDYDGGLIGTAVRDSYRNLQGPGFPSLDEKTPQEYPDVAALEKAVCQSHYWAAFFISPNSSSNIDEVLAGSTSVSYNASDSVSFIWNQARNPTVSDGSLAVNINKLSDESKSSFLQSYLSSKAGSNQANFNLTNPDTIAVISNPWNLQDINIKPTHQGSRLIYNTLLIVLVLIQDFFFLGTLNGLYAQFNMYARLRPIRIICYRTILSLLYTFSGSLVTVGMLYAFRADWVLSGVQFVESWMTLWLFGHLNFNTLDVFTVWLPPPYVPMALITWVVLNVGSVLLPFELSNGFYRWGYMLPAHEATAILTGIWSGCHNTLRYSIPILFALEISSFILSALGVIRRCHYAVIAEENKEKEFQARIDAAIAVQRKQQQRPADSGVLEEEEESVEERKELEAAERAEIKREETVSEGLRPTRSRFEREPMAFAIFDPDSRPRMSRARTTE